MTTAIEPRYYFTEQAQRAPGKLAKRLERKERELAAERFRLEAGAVADVDRSEHFIAQTEQMIAEINEAMRRVDRCRKCGRQLEDPVSIDRGVGSDCWARMQNAARG